MTLAAAADRRRFLFIVTYGRSGSTLLQNIIASNPGYRIRGENNNALYFLYKSYAKLLDAKRDHGRRPKAAHSPWYGIDLVRPAPYARKLAQAFIEEVIRPEDGDRVIGFKEIRYVHRLDDLDQFLEFLLMAFEPAQIVFNMRNAEAVKRSKWWAAKPEGAVLDKLRASDAAFRGFAASHRQCCWIANYDEYSNDQGVLKGLFDFLGEPFEPERIRTIMDEPVSR